MKTDSSSATVTSTKNEVPSLVQGLAASDVTVQSIPMRGRFHCPLNSDAFETISNMCALNPSLRFRSIDQKDAIVRCNHDGEIISTRSFHSNVLKAILLNKADWNLTISKATSQLTGSEKRVLVVGFVNAISQNQAHQFKLSVIRTIDSQYVTYSHFLQFIHADPS